MLDVRALKVRSLDVDFLELSWEINDTTEDVLDYTFQVERSEAVSGPWEALAPPFQDKYLFYDRTSRPFHRGRILLYRLLVTDIRDGKQAVYGPVDEGADADLITLELRRHMGLLLREFTGRRCWLLPVRTFGQRCTCWNNTLQKRTRSGCRSCYDTGFARGYMAPLEIWVQFDPGSTLVEQNTNVGTMHQANTTARCVDVVKLKPRDVLVESENTRWRVVAVNQTEHGRAPIHLELQVHAIPKSEIEYAYEIPLKEALRDLYLSPARNFTNPQTLEAFERDEVPGIYDLYKPRVQP